MECNRAHLQISTSLPKAFYSSLVDAITLEPAAMMMHLTDHQVARRTDERMDCGMAIGAVFISVIRSQHEAQQQSNYNTLLYPWMSDRTRYAVCVCVCVCVYIYI